MANYGENFQWYHNSNNEDDNVNSNKSTEACEIPQPSAFSTDMSLFEGNIGDVGNTGLEKEGTKEVDGKERLERDETTSDSSQPGKGCVGVGSVDAGVETSAESESPVLPGGGVQQTHINCTATGRKIEEFLSPLVFENATEHGEAFNSVGGGGRFIKWVVSQGGHKYE
ncbi:hypothetical protein L6452_40964 [Arctium lappa]|uniref:Uncharacterized protein n=1 Tax=Arctium lappa TaxID=4217 RepID=A0ACB8XPW0_ARCLA|nr:hypothetical protein L6452_40964 [Arctium lappa]